MPHTLPVPRVRKESGIEDIVLKEGLMAYQLVGGVTAYQGYDG